MKSAVREPSATKRVRWTVKDYFRMSEAGVLDDCRVELINGEIIEVLAQANPHRASVTKISHQLLRIFPPPDSWVVVQGTLILSGRSAPDPDLYVLDAPVGTPDEKLPMPLLVVEVSDTTYLKDSGVKLRMYAEAGIADYWIINIPQQRVEVYRSPANPTGERSGWKYSDVHFFARNMRVQLLANPAVSFAVEKLLP